MGITMLSHSRSRAGSSGMCAKVVIMKEEHPHCLHCFFIEKKLNVDLNNTRDLFKYLCKQLKFSGTNDTDLLPLIDRESICDRYWSKIHVKYRQISFILWVVINTVTISE